MKLPSFLRRKALTASPAVVEAISDRRANLWPLLGGGARQRITEVFKTAQSAELPWLYQQSPAVRSVIDLITRNVGQLDLRLYEEISEDAREPRPEHPAAMSLRYPNEQDTRDHFIRKLTKDFLIFDNAYAIKFRQPTNRQVSMIWIPAAMIEVLGNTLFVASGYRVHRHDGTFMDLTDPSDMFHWRGENPGDPRIGTSRLETLRSSIAEDIALQQAIVELANAGLASHAWVSRPLEAPEWTANTAAAFEEDLKNRLSRSDKRPVVLEESMELHDIGVSPRDAQLLDIRKYVVQQVAVLYGVPLGMVGLSEKTPEAQSMFYSDCLAPTCEELTRWFNKSILVEEYGETEYCFEFKLDEKHMGDERIKTLVSGSARAVYTTNEARALLDLPPIDGGDELVTPQNVLVGENPKPSPQVMPPQQPAKPSQDGDHRREPPKALPHIPNQDHVLTNGHKKYEITTIPRGYADKSRQDKNVDKAVSMLRHEFKRQRAAIEAKSAQFDREKWDGELTQAIHNLSERIVELEGSIYSARLGGPDFDMDQVQNFLKAASEDITKRINKTTADDLAAVGAAVAVERLLEERAESAGTAIGARMTMFARYAAAQQAPDFEKRVKTWVRNTDRHADFDGDTVPIGSTWNGLVPGSEANCKCTFTIT